MTVKTTGAEFKRFYFDDAYWPDGTWHEDEEIEIDGNPISEDLAIEDIHNIAALKVTGGIVMGLADGSEPSVESYFKKWRKAQSTVSFVVECDKDKEGAVRAAIRAAGGRITLPPSTRKSTASASVS